MTGMLDDTQKKQREKQKKLNLAKHLKQQMADVKARKKAEKEKLAKEDLEAEKRFLNQNKEGTPTKTGKRRN